MYVCPIMEPEAPLAAVLPCTHLRMCRFLSSGSARNPPADSAGICRHWSSSFPLPITAPIAHGGRAPTIAESGEMKKNIRRQKIPARIQCSSNMASTAVWACAMDMMAYRSREYSVHLMYLNRVWSIDCFEGTIKSKNSHLLISLCMWNLKTWEKNISF